MGTIKAPLEQAPPLVPEFTNEKEVLQHYQNLSSACEEARSKMSELSAQAREHELVVDTIKDLDPERKCFRLIGRVGGEESEGGFASRQREQGKVGRSGKENSGLVERERDGAYGTQEKISD